jgi:hypothetical protein
MNVEIGTVAAQFLFWEYMSRLFGILVLCSEEYNISHAKQYFDVYTIHFLKNLCRQYLHINGWKVQRVPGVYLTSPRQMVLVHLAAGQCRRALVSRTSCEGLAVHAGQFMDLRACLHRW